jgi:hypothetical protein
MLFLFMNYFKSIGVFYCLASFTSKAIKSHKKWQIIKILIFLYFGNEPKYKPIRMGPIIWILVP